MRQLETLAATAENDNLYAQALRHGDENEKSLVNLAKSQELFLAQQQLQHADASVIALTQKHLKEIQAMLRRRVTSRKRQESTPMPRAQAKGNSPPGAALKV